MRRSLQHPINRCAYQLPVYVFAFAGVQRNDRAHARLLTESIQRKWLYYGIRIRKRFRLKYAVRIKILEKY